MPKNTQREVPLNLVRPSPAALRKVINKDELKYIEFVDSIRVKGVLQPPLVTEAKDVDTGSTYYRLVDGLHRYHGAIDAGLETIPVYIITADETQALESQIITNMQRFETRMADYADGLKRLLALNPTLTASELGIRLGKSVTTINNILGLTDLTSEIQALVNDNSINLTNAQVLSKLPENEQTDFLDRAISMVPNQFSSLVTDRLKEIKDAKRQGKKVAPATFSPSPYLQTTATIREEMDTIQVGRSLMHELGITTVEDAWRLAIQWVLHMDVKSVEVQRQVDEKRKKEAEALKAAKKAEKEKKKLEAGAMAVAQVS